MEIGVIAKRYATALLDFAVEQKAEETVFKEMNQLISSYRNAPQLSQALINPTLKAGDKESLLCKAASETEASSVFHKFAALVISHHRESFMLYIAHSYIRLYHAYKHISIGHLVTAAPCSKTVSARLEKWIESQSGNSTNVIMTTDVDPSLMGGFIFRIDDYRLDASIATQFNLIKKQFIEKNKRIV